MPAEKQFLINNCLIVIFVTYLSFVDKCLLVGVVYY